MSDLKNIGFSQWFKDRINDKYKGNHSVARVASVHKDSFTLTKGNKEIFAELSGKFLFGTESAIDLPTTGDWVYADFYDDDSHAIIYKVFPRKTLLKRKSPGKKIDFQLIAANIDVAFIIQSLNDNFNLSRLERYLVMVNEGGIQPIILLSKCDLMATDDVNEIKQKVKEIATGSEVLEFSSISHENLDSVMGLLKPGLTYCLLGSSGVGKTTLINSLINDDVFNTQTVSKIQSKGRHTTTNRQLVFLQSGAMIVDTPGIREIGSFSLDEGMDETFSEILGISQTCKFSNCSHKNEQGCAILAAIKEGKLSKKRYQNYLKMKKESDFNQMSYLDKRKKDKKFGKLIKSVLKNKKKY
jgi:ribosome biogenesis GTPase